MTVAASDDLWTILFKLILICATFVAIRFSWTELWHSIDVSITLQRPPPHDLGIVEWERMCAAVADVLQATADMVRPKSEETIELPAYSVSHTSACVLPGCSHSYFQLDTPNEIPSLPRLSLTRPEPEETVSVGKIL